MIYRHLNSRKGEMPWLSIIHSKWLQLIFSQWIVLFCCVHRTADIVNHLNFVFYFSALGSCERIVTLKGVTRTSVMFHKLTAEITVTSN